ncbi:lysophosphatidic acid phosphatase type 6 [Synchiropus splendidus]|uniref:lysophosphatidic acid phosphatase type 6 n=1 Tax=Synchiropus splendidus TaxID=270530 RepID=UPI00237D98AD|nr:lysophosphatidic acid phosphatase type 6 [Synchiropus splendidus]XP_053733276.1 lysophosphatidic acid phosphatase type 6 [Synchiropus splendidus]
MRKLWTGAGLLGSVSVGLCSVLWTQRKPGGCSSTEPHAAYELKLVQVLFRHGARTPLKSIPDVLEAQWTPALLEPPPHTRIRYVVTDLHGGPKPSSAVEDSYRRNVLSGGSFPGQLTTLGMQQLYDLGARLRRKYVEQGGFLSPAFDPSEVYVRSTNVVRTIESATCLLAGLFDQKQRDVVSIATVAAQQEILYPNYHGCQLLKLLGRHRWAESSALPDIAGDLKQIHRELGIAPQEPVDFILIRDDMVARQTHGLPSPEALHSWSERVERRSVDMICHIFQPDNSESLQLSVGPLLHIMLTNMEQKIQAASEPGRRLFLYSAHDTTLVPCLMALGIFDMRWPPFAADITLELLQHRATKEPVVKVSYMEQDQLIPGCSGVYCPLEEFKRAVSAYTASPELYQQLCDSRADAGAH